VTTDGVGLVTGFIGHLQLEIAIQSNYISNILHALSLLGLLSFHQSSGTGFQHPTFLYHWVPGMSPLLGHSKPLLFKSRIFISSQRSTSKHTLSPKALQTLGNIRIQTFETLCRPLWSEVSILLRERINIQCAHLHFLTSKTFTRKQNSASFLKAFHNIITCLLSRMNVDIITRNALSGPQAK
jgi:hypothetical protein